MTSIVEKTLHATRVTSSRACIERGSNNPIPQAARDHEGLPMRSEASRVKI